MQAFRRCGPGGVAEGDDLLEELQHLAEVARTVVGVDGAGLTMVDEDGPPRWVAATAPAWSRIAAVVGQLRVCGVLSVPVRLAGQPVGTLDAYTTTREPGRRRVRR